jgi:hypothetical protein
MQTPTEETWQAFLAFAVRADRALTCSLATDTELEIRPSDRFILSMFWRSVRLFRASVLLLREDLPEEALIVGRSAFVESLRLAELAAVGSGRDALILCWANQSIEEEKSLVRTAARVGLESDPEALLAYLDGERSKLQNYARRVGVGKFQKFMQEHDASARFGRLVDYWTYQTAHEMVHGSDFALKRSRAKTESGTLAMYLANHDRKFLLGAGLFCAWSALYSAKALAEIFQWTPPVAIGSLLQEAEQFEENAG